MSEVNVAAPPLRANRQLAVLLLSQSVGMVARNIYFVALPLFVLERTGSALSTSVSFLMGFAPYTLAGPLAGHIVDRYSRRDLLIVTDLLYGLTLLALPFTHAPYLIYIIAFTASTFGVVVGTSTVALLPGLVDIAQLAKANSFYTFLRSFTFLVSALGTYLLVEALGKADVFFLCSVLLFSSGAACLALKRDVPAGVSAAEDGGGGPGRGGGFREALGIIWADRHIRGLTLMHLMFMPIFGAFEVFLVIFCAGSLGRANYYTLVSAALGLGLAVGSLTTYRLLRRYKPLNLVFVSFLGYSVGVFLLTRSAVLALAMLACLAMGVIDGFGFTSYEFIRQRAVPSAYRGRVFAAMDALVLLPMPLGYLAVGYFATRASVAAIGVWLSVIGLVLALLSYPLTRGLPGLGAAGPESLSTD